jgi:hypothetical protein
LQQLFDVQWRDLSNTHGADGRENMDPEVAFIGTLCGGLYLLSFQIRPPQGIYDVLHGEIDSLDVPILGFTNSLIQNGSRGLLARQVLKRFSFVHPLAGYGTQAVSDAEDQTTTGSDWIRNVALLVRLTSQFFFSFHFDPPLLLSM